MPSIFARYLAYNIPILQTTDIMVSSNVWSMLYVMSSNSKCMCAAFRPLSYRRASQQCEYPVSGLVWFRLEQMSAVTDSVGEQWWAEHTITNRNAPERHSGARKFKPGTFRLQNYWISQSATFATVIR